MKLAHDQEEPRLNLEESVDLGDDANTLVDVDEGRRRQQRGAGEGGDGDGGYSLLGRGEDEDHSLKFPSGHKFCGRSALQKCACGLQIWRLERQAWRALQKLWQ